MALNIALPICLQGEEVWLLQFVEVKDRSHSEKLQGTLWIAATDRWDCKLGSFRMLVIAVDGCSKASSLVKSL